MMTTANDVLNIAKREKGYKEYPAGSNLNKFGAWYGMNAAPWCAMFVSYCFYTAGMPLKTTTPKGFAYCPYGVDWFKKKGWLNKSKPQPGDVVFYSFDDSGVAEHVGIVESVNGTSFKAWEGNTGASSNANGGEVMLRSRQMSHVTGLGRPPYSTASKPAPSHPVWPGVIFSLTTTPPSKSSYIEVWKQQMQTRGWNITVNDTFDEEALKILKTFQKEKGLKADGQLGPISWNAAWELPITP